MSSDKFFTDSIVDKISGDDDIEDLEKTGKGLVTGRVQEDTERPAWLSSYIRYLCTNCRKGIHNTPDNDSRCRRKGCECRCLTHYIGMDGKARPYGTPDDSFKKETVLPTNPDSDAFIEQINEEWRKSHPEPPKNEKKEVVL